MTPPGDAHLAPRLSPDTLAVVAGRPEQVAGAPMSVPPVLTSTYVAYGEVDYARNGNPTWSAFEQALGALERAGDQPGRARAFGSGMAAVDAVLSLVPLGGLVVAPWVPYSGTRALLRDLDRRGAIRLVEVDIADTDEVLGALDGAALLWVESPTNPLLEVADIPALAEAAHRHGALVAVDNTFATPLAQQPLALGADLVVHSATKYLAGHSDVLLGATVTIAADLDAALADHRTLTGGIAGPMECWLALRGLRTLALRVARAHASAAELARRLDTSGHPAVGRVRHPSLPRDPGHARASQQMRGYGAVLSVELAGTDDAHRVRRAERLTAQTRVWIHATSLGGVESTLERRRRHAEEPDLVPAGLVRLSTGIEDVADLWADLEHALDAATDVR